MVIPCAYRLRALCGNHFELRERWLAGEILIGKNVDVSRVINREQPHLIEIYDFLHRLHQTETQQTVAWLCSEALDRGILRGVGGISLARCNPMPDHAGPEHVGNKVVAASIPREQQRARAAASIDFCDHFVLSSTELGFILNHARRPEQSYRIR